MNSPKTVYNEPEPAAATAPDVWPHLDATQAATAQLILNVAQIPADDYAVHDLDWLELSTELGDPSASNSAQQNAQMMQLWSILERDGTWTHPTAGFSTQARADEAKQSWVDYLSWVVGAPTYEYNGAIPAWGWSGYINGFHSWRGWIMNAVPNKYGHLL